MKKSAGLKTLESFGDEFNAEKLIERLLFIEQVEKGLKDVKDGKMRDYKKAKQEF